MEQALQDLQAQVQDLARRLEEEKTRSSTMERVATAIENMQAKDAKRGDAKLVDTRGVGKPPNFGLGEERVLEKNFPVWQRKMLNYVVSIFIDLKEPLDWAITVPTPITDADLEKAFGHGADIIDQVDNLQEKLHQLYSVLVQVTEGEANDIVCNSQGRGLEAWRKLARRWDPLTGGRIRTLLRFIISPGRAKMDELQGALERWEEQIGKYCNSKDRKGMNRELPEDIQMAALESLVPVELETHLQMNSTRLTSYEEMRNEVVTYVESRIGGRIREARVQHHDRARDHHHQHHDPMEVDSLSKGKSKGKGNQQFQGSCFKCGKPGHKSAECRSAPPTYNGWKGGKGQYGGAKAPSSGKDDKGKGKDKGGKKGWQDRGPGKGKGGRFGKGKFGRPAGSLEDENADAWAEDGWKADDWGWQTDDWKEGHTEEPEGEAEGKTKHTGSLDICATEPDVSSFKTTSGEIVEDEGAGQLAGWLENGNAVNTPGRIADVHKILVAASKMHAKGTLAVVGAKGGAIYRTDSWIGREIQKLIDWAGPKEEFIRLYLERGVYNFYVQDKDGKWHTENYDTGAGETVLPKSFKEQPQGGLRQA